jgi:type I restriction enzyme S subunit
MKQYETYKDSGVEWIGEIPEHWSFKALKHLAKILNGSTPSSSVKEYWNGNISWVTTDDLGKLNDKYIITSRRTITTVGLQSCGTNLAPANSVVMSCRAPIGHLGILKIEACTNQGCKTLVPQNLNYDFLYYSLKNCRIELESLGKGSTFKELSTVALKDYKIVLPKSLEEQTQIANYLNHKTEQLDTLIDKKEQLIRLLQEERTAMINQAVTKGLDPNVAMKDSGIEWLGEIPAHWELSRINFLSSKVGDGLHGTPSYVDKSDYAFINGNNIGEGEVVLSEKTKFVSEEEYLKNKKVLTANTLLMSINGTIGNLAFYKGESIMLGKSAAYINLLPNINKEFIYYYLKSEAALDYIFRELSGSTIKNLSLYSINKTIAPFPSPNEQVEIVSFIKIESQKINLIISKSQQEINLLKEYKTALISEVVTGKVDVREENLIIQEF